MMMVSTKFHGKHCPLLLKKHKPFLSFFIITFILFSWLPNSAQSSGLLVVEPGWNVRWGKLRAEALDRLFPRAKELLETIDPFGFGFVDYRDPLELISFITLYLPGVIFMLNVLFHMYPHVLNFLLFVPKLWLFNLPCLYSFSTSPLKRTGGISKRLRRRRKILNRDDVLFNEVASTDPCKPMNLAHITRLVYKGLVKLTEQQ